MAHDLLKLADELAQCQPLSVFQRETLVAALREAAAAIAELRKAVELGQTVYKLVDERREELERQLAVISATAEKAGS